MKLRNTTTLLSALAVAGGLALAGGLSLASEDVTGSWAGPKSLGTTAESIRASLEGAGYTVRKVKTEDGMFEAYALKDSARYEVYVSKATGEVVMVKRDD